MTAAVVLEPRTRKRRGALGPSYNPDETAALLDLVVTLTNPDGVVFDLTRRVVGGVGTLNEILEVELTTIGHSDIDLEVDDFDGLLEEFLGRPEPTEIWTVIIERESGKRRPKYVRLFGGILDLPWSLQYDREANVVTFDVFAFSKELELASAEPVVRDWSALRMTNTIPGSIATITAGDISILSVGDEFTVGLGDATIGGRETHVILEVHEQDGQIVTVDAWANAHVSAEIMVPAEPYHRFKSPRFLIGALFDEAEITEREINIPAFDFPIPAAVNPNSFPVALDPDLGTIPTSLTVTDDEIEFRFRDSAAAFIDGKWTSGGVDDRFQYASGATDHHLIGDWTAYHREQPATHPILVNVSGVRADGRYAFDFSRGDYWELVKNGTALELHKNGAFNETISASGSMDPLGVPFDRANLEYEPTQDELWVSYYNALIPTSVIQYRAAGGGAWTTMESSADGNTFVMFRTLAETGLIWCTGMIRADVTGYWFKVIDAAAHAFHQDVPGVPPEMLEFPVPPVFPQSVFATNTVRVMGDTLPNDVAKWIVGLGRITNTSTAKQIENFGSHLFAWRIDKGFAFAGNRRITELSLNSVQGFAHGGTLACVHRQPGAARPVYYFYTGTTSLSVSGPGVLGAGVLEAPVVPYADFDGSDVAKALVDLAAGTGTYVQVDENRIGRFVPRRPLAQDGIAPSLPEPLDQESLPVWESYRSSVRVNGTVPSVDESREDDFSITVGPTGDSSRVLEVESSVITTEAIAFGVGQYFFDYVAKLRRQENVTIPETGTLFRPFDQVELGGVRYMVLEAATDLESREQDLVLIEVV